MDFCAAIIQPDMGTFMKPNKTTVGEYLERWLKGYAKPNLSPRGFERYESIVRVHLTPSLGNIPLTQLKPEHIQKHYTVKLDHGLSLRSVRYHHVVLHKELQTALKWGLVTRNTADGVDMPRVRHTEMQTWDEYEVTRFLETAKDSHYYALFHTALFTGMRRSELLALQWRDIDFHQIYVNH
jgi:integrase